MSNDPSSSPSAIVALLSDLRDEGLTLLRQEVALAKAEVGEKAAQAVKSATSAAVGGGVVLAGLIVLLIGVGHLAHHGLAAAGLAEATAQWLGFLLVGAIVSLVGWGLIVTAKRKLTSPSLKPTQTAASLRDDKRWARQKIASAHEPAR